MENRIVENWLDSLEHQFGRRKCEALAAQFLQRTILKNYNKLDENTIHTANHIVELCDKSYHDVTITNTDLNWLRRQATIDFRGETILTQISLAGQYLVQSMLEIQENGRPAWQKSFVISLELNDLDFMRGMSLVQFILEHLD